MSTLPSFYFEDDSTPFRNNSTLSVRRAEAPGSFVGTSRLSGPELFGLLGLLLHFFTFGWNIARCSRRFIPRRKERQRCGGWCTQRVAVESAVVRKKGGSESRRLLEDPDSTENRRDPPARRLVLVEHTMLMLKEGSQEMRTH